MSEPQASFLAGQMGASELAILTGVGVLTGLVTSLLGLGGGLVIVPTLTLLLGFGQREAVATSVTVAAPVALANVIGFQLRGMIVWGLVPRMALGAMLAAAAAALVLTRISDGAAAVLFLIICAYFMLVGWTGRGLPHFWRHSSARSQLTLGMVGGSATGLGGVGGGMVYVPVLSSSSWLPSSHVVPSVSALTLIATLSSLLTFSSAAQLIRWPQALLIAGIALIVSAIGRRYQHHISAALRRRLVGVIIALAAARTLYFLM